MLRHLPNLLSAVRLLIAPAAAYSILRGRFDVALLLLMAAGVSDWMDGYVARRLKVVSKAGAYLDPVADKILLVSIFLAEGVARIMPAWLVALVVARDILILGMAGWGLLFTKIRRFPPSFWGKLSTVVQIAAALLVLADTRAWVSRGFVFSSVAITTAWSGMHYSWMGIRRLREGAHRHSGPFQNASARDD